MKGIEGVYAAISRRPDIVIREALRRQPYGDTEFVVEDPNGYVVVFSELIAPASWTFRLRGFAAGAGAVVGCGEPGAGWCAILAGMTPPPSTMRAVVLERAPAPPEALVVRERPVPEPQPGWVLIEVKAFGLNRSELKTRLGLADPDVTFPRVPGIEATGVVAACPGGELGVGQQVVAMMGGMGRSFDGGYAEFTCVPVAQTIAIRSDLPWTTIGAVPEMLQTAYGALTVGLDVQPGQTLLVRGGTSSVGLTAAALAKRRGLTVLATTRSQRKAQALVEAGVDHMVVDDGAIAERVRALVPGGVDATLELVGAPTLRDSLEATRVHGVVCCAGYLSNQWIVPGFYPTGFIPNGVRLTGYSGDASDLPQTVLQGFLDEVAAGEARIPIAKTYTMDEIAAAHADMEHDRAAGKLVVSTGR